MHGLLPIDSGSVKWTPSVCGLPLCASWFQGPLPAKMLRAVHIFRTSGIKRFFQDVDRGPSTVKGRPRAAPPEANRAGTVAGTAEPRQERQLFPTNGTNPARLPLGQNPARDPKLSIALPLMHRSS